MRLPPHSAEIMRARRAGRIPTSGPFGHVAILTEWDMEVTGAYCIAPPDIDPHELDFSFVAGLEVTIFCCIGTLGRPIDTWLNDVVLAVMACDPSTILILNIDQADKGFAYGLVTVFVRRPDVD